MHHVEMQIIHSVVPDYLPKSTNLRNTQLVISVFFDAKGNNNNGFIDKLNLQSFDSIDKMNLAEFVNNITPNYYYYNGTLSTPPCSKNVYRFIMMEVQHISESQKDLLTSFYFGSQRNATDVVINSNVTKVTKKMSKSLADFAESLSTKISIIITMGILLLSFIL